MSEERFYDYKTAPVNGSDVVDASKTGVSFYDDLLHDKSYMKNKYNLEGEIVMMSPQEYFQLCSDYGFPDSHPSVEQLKQGRYRDTKTLDHLKAVLTVYKKKFPMPYVNKADRAQEGLHRMLVIGDLFGWDHKVPVLVADWADKQKAFDKQKQDRINRITYNIKQAVQRALRYKFFNIEELQTQIQWELDEQFKYSDEIEVPVQFEFTSDDDDFIVSIGNAKYAFSEEDVDFTDAVELADEEDVDITDIDDLDDFLVRYFGDDWEETHPHLKDVFDIKESVEPDTAASLTVVGEGIQLRNKIEPAWSIDTCHPSYRNKWTPQNPSVGQCAVTAMYLNEIHGWKIYDTMVGNSRHFFNKDSNGFIYDLTADQFPSDDVDYDNCRERKFTDLFKSCKDRYKLFKENIRNLTEDLTTKTVHRRRLVRESLDGKEYSIESAEEELTEELATTEYKQETDVEFNEAAFSTTNRLFVVGLSGSGKSTLSKKLAKEYNGEYVELDKFDYEGNTVNYSEGGPQIVLEFLRDNPVIDDFNLRIECFVAFILEKKLHTPVIIEGVQLLDFGKELAHEAVILLDPPIEQLIQQFRTREANWRDVSINGVQPKSSEELDQLLKQSYSKDKELIDKFKSELEKDFNEEFDSPYNEQQVRDNYGDVAEIKQMDEAIQREFAADNPGEGCIFIAPNGKFINTYPKLDDHEDLCVWLEEQGFGENPKEAEWIVETFDYVRCRNNPHNLCYIELPIKQITRKQVYSLEEWLETKVRHDGINVELPNGAWKRYSLIEYEPKDIIKRITRYYSSGNLYETLN